MASSKPIRRIQKELKDLVESPVERVSAQPIDDNLLNWEGQVTGAPGTPYEGGIFKFRMDFPDDYPFKPPKVAFTTKIYHPGINEQGQICISILRSDEWKPAMRVIGVLQTIREKLDNPSPDDPFMPDIAQQVKDNYSAFVVEAKRWTKEHAH